MTTRFSRLLCSKTFLLSVLSVLGICELGRNLFETVETSPEYNQYIVVNKVPTTEKLVGKTTYAHKNEVTAANKKTEKAADIPGETKNKKYVRHKILLLAYARYCFICMSVIITPV